MHVINLSGLCVQVCITYRLPRCHLYWQCIEIYCCTL